MSKSKSSKDISSVSSSWSKLGDCRRTGLVYVESERLRDGAPGCEQAGAPAQVSTQYCVCRQSGAYYRGGFKAPSAHLDESTVCSARFGCRAALDLALRVALEGQGHQSVAVEVFDGGRPRALRRVRSKRGFEVRSPPLQNSWRSRSRLALVGGTISPSSKFLEVGSRV